MSYINLIIYLILYFVIIKTLTEGCRLKLCSNTDFFVDTKQYEAFFDCCVKHGAAILICDTSCLIVLTMMNPFLSFSLWFYLTVNQLNLWFVVEMKLGLWLILEYDFVCKIMRLLLGLNSDLLNYAWVVIILIFFNLCYWAGNVIEILF